MTQALTKYTNWLKRKNFSANTIQTYSKIISKYRQQKFNTANIQKMFRENLQKYQAGYLVLEKTALTSYAKFQKLKVGWERIAQIIPRVQKKFFATINEEEFIKLKASQVEISPTAYQRNNVILDFLFYTGLRIGELVNIKHSDYYDNSLRIYGKGNKIRYIPLPPFLVDHFNPYATGYLFPSQRASERGNDNKPLPAEYIRQILKARANQAGIKKRITPHTFRRSFATLSDRNGIRLTTIQKILGHSKLETTAQYIHNDYETIYQDYSKLWKTSEPTPRLTTYE